MPELKRLIILDDTEATTELEAQAKAKGIDVLRLAPTQTEKVDVILGKLSEEDKNTTHVYKLPENGEVDVEGILNPQPQLSPMEVIRKEIQVENEQRLEILRTEFENKLKTISEENEKSRESLIKEIKNTLYG